LSEHGLEGLAGRLDLLGYEDPNAFYRAFRTWEGTTPAHWRIAHLKPA
jgi:AraC-like DNA-binding protein